MKLMFILAAVTGPLFAYIDKGATGILLATLFIFLAAFLVSLDLREMSSD